jgi:hypothetical protein
MDASSPRNSTTPFWFQLIGVVHDKGSKPAQRAQPCAAPYIFCPVCTGNYLCPNPIPGRLSPPCLTCTALPPVAAERSGARWPLPVPPARRASQCHQDLHIVKSSVRHCSSLSARHKNVTDSPTAGTRASRHPHRACFAVYWYVPPCPGFFVHALSTSPSRQPSAPTWPAAPTCLPW